MTGADLHESKGTAAATVGQVFVADGAASGGYQKLTAASLTGTGNPFGAQLLHVREQQTSGVASTTAFSGNTVWHTRILNTAITNEIASATLVSNVISLPAGTYHVHAYGQFRASGGDHKLRIRNISDSVTLVSGPGCMVSNTDVGGNLLSLQGRFTLGGTKNIGLHHYITGTTGAQTFGAALTSGDVEVYAEVFIWKIA